MGDNRLIVNGVWGKQQISLWIKPKRALYQPPTWAIRRESVSAPTFSQRPVFEVYLPWSRRRIRTLYCERWGTTKEVVYARTSTSVTQMAM